MSVWKRNAFQLPDSQNLVVSKQPLEAGLDFSFEGEPLDWEGELADGVGRLGGRDGEGSGEVASAFLTRLCSCLVGLLWAWRDGTCPRFFLFYI